MFGPHASPVVNAHMTWQIGPATYVSTSRSFAYREIQSSSRLGEPLAHLRQLAPRSSGASAAASSADLQTNADARVIRSRRTSVRNPPDSAAARAPR